MSTKEKQALLFVIDSGVDGSGKDVQTKKLLQRLKDEGLSVYYQSFPDYETPTCSAVKMYLAGEFGKDAEAINPRTASTFFAIDRYASYKTKWEKYYKGEDAVDVILFDRYVTSNMVHQAVKISDENERNEYLDWLYDLEYKYNQIPEPDCVIFLNMPPDMSQKLIANRANKITGESQKDIHESNVEYLFKCYENALDIADKYEWNKITCVENDRLRTIDEIHEDVYSIVKKYI